MRLSLRAICGYRAGDKGDIANVAIFADDDETYALIVREVTAVRVKEHILRRCEPADRDLALAEDGALNIVIVGGGPTGVELAPQL